MRRFARQLNLGFAALVLGVILPASASGGMILLSLDDIQAAVAGELAGEMQSEPAPAPPFDVPEEHGYLADSTQSSSCGSGNISTQNSSGSSPGLLASVEIRAIQPSLDRLLSYSNPPVPPSHLWRLFRPPRK